MLIINTVAIYLEDGVLTYGDPHTSLVYPYALFLCFSKYYFSPYVTFIRNAPSIFYELINRGVFKLFINTMI